tara:strand:+ start:529 stop:3990 length:3462 start_codon:yes stop_codon:yes gene_type:complete
MHNFDESYLSGLSINLREKIKHIVDTISINEEDLNLLTKTILEFDMKSEFEALVQYCISNNQYDLLRDFTNCLNKIQSRENPEFWISIYQWGLLSLDDDKISVIINNFFEKAIYDYYNPIHIPSEGVDSIADNSRALMQSVVVSDEEPNRFNRDRRFGRIPSLGGTLHEEIPNVFFLEAIFLPKGTSLETLNPIVKTEDLTLQLKKYYVDYPVPGCVDVPFGAEIIDLKNQGNRGNTYTFSYYDDKSMQTYQNRIAEELQNHTLNQEQKDSILKLFGDIFPQELNDLRGKPVNEALDIFRNFLSDYIYNTSRLGSLNENPEDIFKFILEKKIGNCLSYSQFVSCILNLNGFRAFVATEKRSYEPVKGFMENGHAVVYVVDDDGQSIIHFDPTNFLINFEDFEIDSGRRRNPHVYSILRDNRNPELVKVFGFLGDEIKRPPKEVDFDRFKKLDSEEHDHNTPEDRNTEILQNLFKSLDLNDNDQLRDKIVSIFKEHKDYPDTITSELLKIYKERYPYLDNFELKDFRLYSAELTGYINYQTLPKLPCDLEAFTMRGLNNLLNLNGLPRNLKKLSIIEGVSLQTLYGLPENLEVLFIEGLESLTSFHGLPSKLKCLYVKWLELNKIDFFPTGLESLCLDGFFGKNLSWIPKNSSIKYLSILGCDELDSTDGIENLEELETLHLKSSCIKEINHLPRKLEKVIAILDELTDLEDASFKKIEAYLIDPEDLYDDKDRLSTKKILIESSLGEYLDASVIKDLYTEEGMVCVADLHHFKSFVDINFKFDYKSIKDVGLRMKMKLAVGKSEITIFDIFEFYFTLETDEERKKLLSTQILNALFYLAYFSIESFDEDEDDFEIKEDLFDSPKYESFSKLNVRRLMFQIFKQRFSNELLDNFRSLRKHHSSSSIIKNVESVSAESLLGHEFNKLKRVKPYFNASFERPAEIDTFLRHAISTHLSVKKTDNQYDHLRLYVPGDDPRLIDHNSSARHGEYMVKVFKKVNEINKTPEKSILVVPFCNSENLIPNASSIMQHLIYTSTRERVTIKVFNPDIKKIVEFNFSEIHKNPELLKYQVNSPAYKTALDNIRNNMLLLFKTCLESKTQSDQVPRLIDEDNLLTIVLNSHGGSMYEYSLNRLRTFYSKKRRHCLVVDGEIQSQ